MSRTGKRLKSIREQIESGKAYSIDEALEILQGASKVKFTESVDVAIRLGVDPRKSDQNVRGSTVLPNGTGKKVRVAVFTQGENVEKAETAGADVVGMDDLHDQIKEGDLNFDVVIGCHARGWQIGTIAGPERPDAKPEGGYGNHRCRNRGEERQVRPGTLPHGQGWHHSHHDRQG